MRRGAIYFRLRAMARVWKRDGPAALVRAIAAYLSPRLRADRRRKADDAEAFDSAGYDTGAIAFLDGLTIVGGDPGDANPYDATPSYDFDTALAMLDIDVEGATFVDLGSGKGRVLLLAAAQPFARIIGIEFAEELQAIARANLRRHARTRGADPRIELHTDDAARFAFPDDRLVVFLFNPFGAATIETVARRLHASWQARARDIRIIYVNPQHGAEWRTAGFRLIAAAPDRRLALYAPNKADPTDIASAGPLC